MSYVCPCCKGSSNWVEQKLQLINERDRLRAELEAAKKALLRALNYPDGSLETSSLGELVSQIVFAFEDANRERAKLIEIRNAYRVQLIGEHEEHEVTRKALEAAKRDSASKEEFAFAVGVDWCARQLERYMPVGNGDPESSRLVFALWDGNDLSIPFDPEKGDPSELYDDIEAWLKAEAKGFRESAARWARKNIDAAIAARAKEPTDAAK